MENGGHYENMKIKRAENGWVLCYYMKTQSSMLPHSMYDDNSIMKEHKMVFEESKGISNEKALDNALAEMKKMLLTNMKGA